jgi:glyoxylase-like metal-dependent hydrolase (beta-lactamase superfamily II)
MKKIVLKQKKGSERYNVYPIRSLWGNCYIIETSNGLFLVDTCEPGYTKKILRTMKRIGRSDLRFIFITHAHFDHYGNAEKLRKETGAPIVAPRIDAGDIRKGATPIKYVRSGGIIGKMLYPFRNILWKVPETEPDILVEDGDSLEDYGLDAQVIHTPGHTNGHCSLLLADKYLFAGDQLLVQPFPMIQSFFAIDWGDVVTSHKKIKKLKPELTFPGLRNWQNERRNDHSSSPSHPHSGHLMAPFAFVSN